jgi:hypothetical protein
LGQSTASYLSRLTMKSEADVAIDWINYHVAWNRLGDEAFKASSEKQRYWWAVDQFMEWTRNEPRRSWSTIVEIWNRVDRSDLDMLSTLGAGEVEDLLCNYGEDYFPVIEQFCQIEPDFRTVLRMVWQSSMSSVLWQKVQELRGGPNL